MLIMRQKKEKLAIPKPYALQAKRNKAQEVYVFVIMKLS